MAFDQGIKLRAIELYMELKSVSKVHEKICDEYKNNVTKLPSEITVRKWIEANDLPAIAKNTEIDVLIKARNREIESRLSVQEKQQSIYNRIVEKGVDELEEMEFTSAPEAVKAIDLGIQGSNKIGKDMLSLQFVEDVIGVVAQEVDDPDLKRSIALGIRKVFQKHFGNT